MPLVASRFEPAWWLRGAHPQTLWPALMRRPLTLPVREERLELDDGDFLQLAWSGPADGPVVLLLHGLEGSLRSHYATPTMQRLNDAGFRTCLMHFRNCGGVTNRLPISYHSGKTDDPLRVIAHIRDTTGSAPFGAVGVSLGGNVLLKLLAETPDGAGVQRAMAISVPFVLDDCARRLERGLSRLYQRHLVGRLCHSYRRKFGASPPIDVDFRRIRTFREFDDRVTAPLHGFAGVDDYYARCSSRRGLGDIRVPTLILHARNDPFMTAAALPDPAELSACVWLELTDDGGHVGFVGGSVPGHPCYFLERRAADWFCNGPDSAR
jgi:predicted alpha/beta-fold hydrolase